MELKDIGMNEKQIQAMGKRGIKTVEGFLRWNLLHYYDFSTPKALELNDEMKNTLEQKQAVAIVGNCFFIKVKFEKKRCLVSVRVKDEKTGSVLFVNFFQQFDRVDYIKSCEGKDVIVGGVLTFSVQYQTFQMLNPIVFSQEIENYKKVYPVYHSVTGFTEELYQEYVRIGNKNIGDIDFLPTDLLQKYHLPNFKKSVELMHFPNSQKDVVIAEKRLIYEDLLYLAVKMELQNSGNKNIPIYKMEKQEKMEQYLSSLPYKLTEGQEQAILGIGEKMSEGVGVNVLVQGDVGCGKTTIAIALLIKAAENGFQAALMAPSTILARQHYEEIKSITEKMGIKTVLMSGEVKGKDKKMNMNAISSGQAKIIVGTQGVIADKLEYKELGLVITDEEHKFAVMQREKFWEKAVPGTHRISMSATPIPRTLAQTIYGQHVDLFNILTMPGQRKPIRTAVCKQYITGLDYIIKQVKIGHQAYIVMPSINMGKKTSIEEHAPKFQEYLGKAGVSSVVVHGKTKKEDAMESMKKFKAGEISVLIATTVIEVGVNVPNATVIMITDADLYGFSTLHQLRGRVGRGKDFSYCILQSQKNCERLDFLCGETNGFKIAKEDLRTRGAGSLTGIKQSGNDYYVKLMLAYPNMFQYAVKDAKNLCQNNTGRDMVKRFEELFVIDADNDER